jgi:subtilisin family serine protease
MSQGGSSNGGNSSSGHFGPGDFGSPFSEGQPETTGRYIVTFSDEVHGDEGAVAEALRSVAGIQSVASTRDYEAGTLDVDEAGAADAIVFTELGLAVVSGDAAIGAMSVMEAAAADPRILAIEPELVMRAIDEQAGGTVDYLRGYRDAASHLFDQFAGASTNGAEAGIEAASFADSDQFTWGLQATGVSASSARGQGIKVAVLDTGVDLRHPDLAGRDITSQSFVPGETAQDGNGHGTHCIGTSCGPVSPGQGRRYGIASEAAIFAGKVLSNAGSGGDGSILAGIDWAVRNGCQVISMSLGADVRFVSTAYETAGRRALASGTLIVAAAGNNADRRKGKMGFVGTPANSRSIMAVGALDSQLRIGYFSARSNWLAGRGGQVDVAAPGVDVYSSVPMPKRYDVHSGTSMATPHVAGIAALWAKAGGGAGSNLWSTLVRSAQRLNLPAVDVGAGLAQAPQ